MPVRFLTVAQPLSHQVRGAARRAAGRVARRVGVQRVRQGRYVRTGVVEVLDRAQVSGWIGVVKGAPPVRLSLRVNDVEVVSAMVADRTSRRTPSVEARRFRFLLNSLWDYVGTLDRLSVVVEGQALPIAGSGTVYKPEEDGAHTLADLRVKLAEGYVFTRTGWLQLSKKLDVVWGRRALAQADHVRAFLSETFGYDAFFMYGTMLGAVREGGFIGHDSDLDLAYLSKHTDGYAVAAELRDIAFAMIEAGWRIMSYQTHLHITSKVEGANMRIDLFHTYFDADGKLCFPYGVAGTGEFRKSDWKGLREVDFEGSTGLIPVAAEPLLEVLYGPGWRSPQPGFQWERDRKSRAHEGLVPSELIQEVHWANFYKHVKYTSGSAFFAAVDQRPDVPRTVVDIGCGDGRDSIAHAGAGRRVFGIDRSHVGIRNAIARADREGLADLVTFQVCDVTEATALAAVVREARSVAAGAPVLFYLRFFLHSIPEHVQDGLLKVIAAEAEPGDVLAAEFRTDHDEETEKAHGRHYRRYQNGPAFGANLQQTYGFDLLDETEGRGLSPYKDEDPYLYRVIARRR